MQNMCNKLKNECKHVINTKKKIRICVRNQAKGMMYAITVSTRKIRVDLLLKLALGPECWILCSTRQAERHDQGACCLSVAESGSLKVLTSGISSMLSCSFVLSDLLVSLNEEKGWCDDGPRSRDALTSLLRKIRGCSGNSRRPFGR